MVSPPPLFKHQQDLLDATWELPAWAILFQTGVGKTAPTIHSAVRLFGAGKIDCVLVVAPGGVHRNWITDELPKHCPIPWRGLDWHTTRAKAHEKLCEPNPALLSWFAITYDALLTPRGRDAAIKFISARPRNPNDSRSPLVADRKFLFVIDEGSRVKNPTAQRTKKVAALRKLANYVRLLNGTPVTSGPTDLYSQMKILDEMFWIRHGIGSFTAFQARFCVMRKIVVGGEDDRNEADEPSLGRSKATEPYNVGDTDIYEQLDLAGIAGDVSSAPTEKHQPDGDVFPTETEKHQPATTGRTIEVIVGYRELDKLHDMIKPLSTRLTKEQAGLNLPPKLYQRLLFDLLPEQRRIYDQLRKEFMIELDNGVLITASMAMVRLMRLQQITCGFVTDPNDPEGPPIQIIPGRNPRLEQFQDWLEDIGKQPLIVWARFTHDVNEICRELGPARCVRYDGKVSETEKAKALDLFRSGKRQICVAKAASMGVGLTLIESSISFLYSNTFSLFERLQLEDRQHRVGQHNAVTYVDLIANKTVDEKILKSLRENADVADKITGDSYRAWLVEE